MRDVAGRRPSRTRFARRRASVLILVMTLLGVLFVMGVAFLASMNFEAQMIASQRQRDGSDLSVDSIADEVGGLLYKGLLGEGGAPFGGSLDAAFDPGVVDEVPDAIGEIPGVHNFFAPIEPYEQVVGGTAVTEFRNVSDLWGLTGACDAGHSELRDQAVDASWPSGVPFDSMAIWVDSDCSGECTGGTNDGALCTVGNGNVECTGGGRCAGAPDKALFATAVDADGDGITDTLQYDVTGLGFSPSQVSRLAVTLNPTDNPDGRVSLGTRVLAHGGMVNLNASHPLLLSNVLDLRDDFGNLNPALLGVDNSQNYAFGFFRHTPTLSRLAYSPWQEESVLRRRNILPPRIMPPTELHGNPIPYIEDAMTAGGDMAGKLFPVVVNNNALSFETAFEGGHRYVPFGRGERVNPLNSASPLLFAVRMDPDQSSQWQGGFAYDRRHLVTTVSYDNNLARGGRVVTVVDGNSEATDLLVRMREANWAEPNDECPPALPFEYANYPQTIQNDYHGQSTYEQCQCPIDENADCSFDSRKGRLKLSLAWLDDAFIDDGIPENDFVTKEQWQRLIHDAFLMLVGNAQGAGWDEIDCSITPQICQNLNLGEKCNPVDNLCHDEVTGLSHRQSRISQTAASLTANLIDFADADNVPTRVAMRYTDFRNPTQVGRAIDIGPAGYAPEYRYVYGVEQQPYITEVATAADATSVTARAVEFFNPYDVPFGGDRDGDGLADYWLFEVDPAVGMASVRKTPLDNPIAASQFTVLFSGAGADLASPALGNQVATSNGMAYQTTGQPLSFQNGWVIYLVRLADIDGVQTAIVVDQFDVAGLNTGRILGPGESGTFALRRSVAAPDDIWKAPVPVTVEVPVDPLTTSTLGGWNGNLAADVRPVEVNFANTGSFTKVNKSSPNLGVALPTTGSLLLLMREANRPFTDLGKGYTKLAFTSHLGPTRYAVARQLNPGTIDNHKLIDNGRMPVFDDKSWVDANFVKQYAHHLDPAITPVDAPGGSSALPWGQLVFDYFTALPLANEGPYFVSDFSVPNARPDAQPQVDLEGLRVHGRININAAPWRVMAGLPLIPMEKIAAPFRLGIGEKLGLWDSAKGDWVVPTDQAAPIGDDRARAIAAYRDLREIVWSVPDDSGILVTVTTGDYGDVDGGHGWNPEGSLANVPPAARRGPGFLSVGELANVRQPAATVDPTLLVSARVDGGEVGKEDGTTPIGDYVKAVALLVGLGDWVTVSSDVFTVYGTLRGDFDYERFGLTGDMLDMNDKNASSAWRDAAVDVDTRAIRFQETVDRLPVFLGASGPQRIGERTVGKYIDIHND